MKNKILKLKKLKIQLLKYYNNEILYKKQFKIYKKLI